GSPRTEPRTAPHWVPVLGGPPCARASPGRGDTAGNTHPPTARRPPCSVSGAAWSAHATATYVATAHKANTEGVPSDPLVHPSPHWSRAHADGDGTAHCARGYGAR